MEINLIRMYYMDSNDIRRGLAAIDEIVAGWAEGFPVTEIEKDLVLEKLRHIYGAVKFSAAEVPAAPKDGLDYEAADDTVGMGADLPTADVQGVCETPVNEELFSAFEKSADDKPAPADVTVGEEPSEANLSAEIEAVQSATTVKKEVAGPILSAPTEPVLSAAVEQEEPASPTAGAPHELSDGSANKTKPDRKLVLSLYDYDGSVDEAGKSVGSDSEERAEADAGTQADRKNAAQTFSGDDTIKFKGENTGRAVLGEVIRQGERTVGEAYAENNRTPDVASRINSGRVESLRKAIGINEKFMMIRDMFASDTDAYERAIGELEAFDNLDDAMIHIYENYSWNPDNEAVKFLIDLLTRKLS